MGKDCYLFAKTIHIQYIYIYIYIYIHTHTYIHTYRITFKIKTGYYLKPLTFEKMKLLGITKSKITINEKGKNVPNMEITEVVVIQQIVILSIIIIKKNQEFYIHLFLKNRLVNYQIFLKTFDSEFSYIEVWFTDKNSKPLETEDKTNFNY